MKSKYLLRGALIGALALSPTIAENVKYAQPHEKFSADLYMNLTNLAEADSLYNAFFAGKEFKKGDGHKHFLIWRSEAADRADASGNIVAGSTPYPVAKMDRLARQAPSLASTPGWQAIGPFSWDRTINSGWNPGVGRLNGMTEDPNDSNTLYACSPWGGLWKSTTGGASWNNMTDGVPVFGCSEVVVDPTNSQVVYITTGDRDSSYNGFGVWKSTDGGATWSQTSHVAHTKGYHLRMHPTDNKILASSSNRGLYLTKDAGVTWTKVAEANRAEDIEFLPGNPNLLFMIENNYLSYYNISTGATSTINGITGSTRSQIAVSPAAPNRVYVFAASGGGTEGIWHYEHGSATLTQKMGYTAGNRVNLSGYAISPVDPSDAGQHWYDMAFAVSPTDANKVYTGIINVWYSSDAGVTWTGGCKWSSWSSCPNYTHADIHGIYTHGNNVYTVSDGGLFKSSDHMNTTTDLTTGMNITMFYNFGQSPQDRNVMIGGTQDNGVFVIRNGKWTTELGADAYGGFVDVTDKDIMYYAYGPTYRSTTAFEYGQSSSKNVNSSNIKEMDQHPSDVNKMIGAGAGLFYSSNRGVNWTNLVAGTFYSPFYAQSNPNVAYAIKSTGEVYKTTNGGSSWSVKSTGLPSAGAAGLAVDPTDENIVWVAYTGTRSDKIYKTTNGGSSWTNYTATGFTESVAAIAAGGQGNEDVYIGTNTGIHFRNKDKTSWINWSGDLPWMKIKKLYTHLGDKKLRAVTWGRSVWEGDLYAESGTSSTTQSSDAQSSVAASSDAGSSVALSSVALSSSVGVSSSVSGDICDGVADWEAKSYDWSGSKEYVVYLSKLYSHTDWVSASTPDNNSGWTYEGDCAVELSSSVVLSSSADVVLSSQDVQSSSSELIVAVEPTRAYGVFMDNGAGRVLVRSESENVNSVRLLNAQGQQVVRGLTMNGTDWVVDISTQNVGVFLLEVRTQKGTQVKRLQVR